MKLIVAVLKSTDIGSLRNELTEKGYPMTLVSSSGGFLKDGNSTILVGVEEEKIQEVIELIEITCKKTDKVITPPTLGESVMPSKTPVEITVGKATVFVMDVEDYFCIS